ncbi:MAG: sel1 repeat family protein [Polyangiaceae bacterium]|nr:sel1 repeat family protein [Polyangiaceae bacterium]
MIAHFALAYGQFLGEYGPGERHLRDETGYAELSMGRWTGVAANGSSFRDLRTMRHSTSITLIAATSLHLLACASSRRFPTDDPFAGVSAVVDSDSMNTPLQRLISGCREKNPASCFELGVWYFSGDQATRNLQKAASLFEQSCDLGDSNGCLNLGIMRAQGNGVDRDYEIAQSQLTRSCDLGNPQGCLRLAQLIMATSHPDKAKVRSLLDKARLLLEDACKAGQAEGCRMLGLAYRDGTIVVANQTTAFQYFSKSCDLGSSPGCVQTGFMYANGLGVAKNGPKALNLLEPVCAEPIHDACVIIGQLCLGGSGVPVNYARSKLLFEAACSASNLSACVSLGDLYREGKGVKKSPYTASEIYGRACDKGDVDACFWWAATETPGLTFRVGTKPDVLTQACNSGSPVGCLGAMVMHARRLVSGASQSSALEYQKKACDLGVKKFCR